VKDLGIRGPVERHDGLEAVQAEGGDHGQVGPIVLGRGPDDPLATGRAPEPTCHGEVDTRLVDEFAAPELDRLDQCLVVLPRLLDPFGVALRRVERFFLRGNPKRRTTRHMVGTLTWMPVVSTARVHNSSQVASGCSVTSRRTCAWAAASKRGR
jgi:hypothetical protein